MSWTKLGDEFSDAARDLSDPAWRTHIEALLWSNRRALDLTITKNDVRRFAETDNPDAAIAELVETGWWQDLGDGWWIGCRFEEWQLERAVVEHRKRLNRERVQRARLHKAGDHSKCLPGADCRKLRAA